MSFVTVWAPRNDPTLGTWSESTATGWTHLIYFETLDDLMNKMKNNGLRGKVDVLGIVAHGDAGGLIQLGRPLTLETLPSFANSLNRLRYYLKPEAVVTFYSCIAAVGEGGTNLLKSLSRHLPGRWIVAFTVFGIASTIMGHPGLMGYNVNLDPTRSMGMLNPSIPYAKWAHNGEIVHWPVGEGP
jgi:hypothetical protein